jgi:capsular polysaccharide biosynthesis protein
MTGDQVLICRESAPHVEIEDAIHFGHNANYYHFICEDLPRLLLFEEKTGPSERAILVDRNIRPWQEHLLTRLGFDQRRWRGINFDVPVRLPQLNVPSLLSRDLLVHPKAVDLIRSRLALDGGNAEPRPGKRLYLARGSKGSRNAQFMNEDAIARQLLAQGFAAVETGNMSLGEQIELFSDAEIVAGPGGAALTNLIFAPRGCAALVLASGSDAGETFSSLASAIGQDYFVCLGDGYPRPDYSWIHTNFDFSVDPGDVSLALEKILARKRGISN